jgi:hypothetical protein
MAGPATLYQTGIHSARPANGSGCVLYACTTHGLVDRDDGTSWTTFLTLPSAGVSDHGALTGLGDDDHTQYFNDTRHDAHDHTGVPGVGGGGAPTTSQYIVGAADGGLSAEKVKAALYKNYDPDEYPTDNAVSNEFDGGSGGSYTWDSAPTASDENTTIPGHLYIEHAVNSTRLYRATYAPGATAFTVVAKVSMAWPEATASTTQFGICLLDSGDSVIWRALMLDDGSGNPTTLRYFDTAGTVYALYANASASVYLLIQRTSGGAYTGFVSLDGKIWVQGGGSTPGGTVAKVGFQVVCSNTVKRYYAADFIRVFDSATRKIGV